MCLIIFDSWGKHFEILSFCITGNPVQVDINMYVRSMGPISEMDMVSKHLFPLIFQKKH